MPPEVSVLPRPLRNVAILVASVVRHAVDDPALLVVQVSRRAPLRVRRGLGGVLERAARSPRLAGIAALGAHMAGHDAEAERRLADPRARRTVLHAEVAVLQDRTDLVDPALSPASTRARAAWRRGDLSEATEILRCAGRGHSRYARTLASELDLLDGEHGLPAGRSRAVPPPGDEPGGLRVLHIITNSLPHTQSGYSLRTHRILKALSARGVGSIALTRTGYPVMVGKLLARECDIVDGIEYRRVLPARLGATPWDRLIQEVETASRIVDEQRPHVLHATTDHRNALVAEALSHRHGIPWVYEVRGLVEQTWIASHRGEDEQARAAASERVARTTAIETAVARRADHVVTLSRTMANTLIARGVDRSALTIVPNGVEASLLGKGLSPGAARARLDGRVPHDALAVGAVSALVEYEGLDVLLRAAALLVGDPTAPAELRERVVVVVAGDGTAAPGLAALARELGISERLVMPGRVDRTTADTWVQALDVVIVPRRDDAVCRLVPPQKPVEAMALGRPVVVSDLPVLREVIEPAQGGSVSRIAPAVVVPAGDPRALADALRELLSDPGLRADMGAAGRATAAARTWDDLAARYSAVYSQVRAGRTQGAAQ